MNRIYRLFTLFAAVACSSENSGSRPPIAESTAGAPNSRESMGNGVNFSGAGGAAEAIEPTGGSLISSYGGGSSLPGVERPWKVAPTRETARAVLDRVTGLYQDYASAAYPQGTHRVVGKIVETDLTAHTNVVFVEADWVIRVTAGWITLPKMTVDVLTLSSCHEMGHFVGGFPFKYARPHDDGTAVAAEGQADYFATKDCLPRVWADETDSNAAAFAELGSSERELCTKAYSDPKSQYLCGRILTATLRAAQIFYEEGLKDAKTAADAADAGAGAGDDADREMPAADPKLETPDPTVVTATKGDHPKGQCRLDTLVAGSLCDVKTAGTTIPGYVPPYSKFSAASQEAARPFACQDGPGARPKCWFHPNTSEFDCSAFGTRQCVIQNGEPAIRSCDPLAGLSYFPCLQNEVCLPDADDDPACVPG